MSQTDADRVIVPAIGTGGSLSVIRSLGQAGYTTMAVSEKQRPPSFSSRHCDERYRVPSPQTDLDGYADALLTLAANDDVGTIVPVREPDVYVLAERREEFAEHVGVLWPTADGLNRIHDRKRLFAAAEDAGVSVPETIPLDEVEDWNRERIVKGRHAILTADNAESVPEGEFRSPPKTIFLEPGEEPDVEAIIDAMDHVPITQAYVDGTEYCFRGLYDDGEAVVTSQKKLVRGYKYCRGPSIYHEAVEEPALEKAGRALLDELDYTGMASVGFIRDSDGEFNLLEINPRIPSSLPMDIHAGLDYPKYFWELATEGAVTAEQDYQPGTASHLLRGEAVHLHSVLREEYPLTPRPSGAETTWDIARSLVEQPQFDYLRLDDPAPFVRDLTNAGRSMVPLL
ncbi:carboxylate--amine ligase [Halonotius roseus]|uniref:Carboxylate--amine ligase n=1 Tax=Halonotius roseus TaxID=2511997 RepID=A0A544QMZ4_9EURY|nr:ATP-grasp domain-containing protein [Halonotius roseus]TQQ80244.1 carboxylate--amine ligase [Halonotius roseus]